MKLSQNHFSNIATFCIALALFSSWVSQSVLDLACAGIVLLWLASLANAEVNSQLFANKSLNKILPVMLAYFVVACLGFYFNARPEAEVLFSLERFSWVIFLVFLVWSFQFINYARYFNFFYLLYLLPALYSFHIFLNNGYDLVTGKGTDYRIIGILQSATYHSHIGGALFVAGLAFLILNYKTKLKEYLLLNWVYILTTILIFLSVFFSKTRGSWLAILAGLFTLLAVKFGKNFIKISLAVVVLLIPLFFLTPIGDAFKRKGPDECRIILYQVHWGMLKAYPLLGIGYRDNMRDITDYWPVELQKVECENHRLEGSQAHNQYLNVAATTGILGFICYMLIIGYFYFLNWQWYKKTKSNLSIVALSLQTYFLVSCLTEITFEFAKIRILILTIWALVVYEYDKLKKLQ